MQLVVPQIVIRTHTRTHTSLSRHVAFVVLPCHIRRRSKVTLWIIVDISYQTMDIEDGKVGPRIAIRDFDLEWGAILEDGVDDLCVLFDFIADFGDIGPLVEISSLYAFVLGKRTLSGQ